MKTADEWISEIQFEIERLRLNGRKVYFQMSLSMTKEIASKIEWHFKRENLDVEVQKCHSCENKYTIIITWKL